MRSARRHLSGELLVAAAVAVITGSAAAAASASQNGRPVVYAAGDIACSSSVAMATSCQQAATAKLIGLDADAVLPLGDNQYGCGAYSAYRTYYSPTWGVQKARTDPVVGNHEYYTSGTGCDSTGQATGYFDYFDGTGALTGPAGVRGQGWYSFNLGAWHIIALNANCLKIGGCGSSSPEGEWLEADLAADPATCTLAYWHQPRWSSSVGNLSSYGFFWAALYNSGVSLVLNGHAHVYERFAPIGPAPNGSGQPVPTKGGMVEIVAGTGGEDHASWGTIQPGSVARDNRDFGVLRLVLHASSYDWSFVPVAPSSGFTDSGSASCR